ncbi:MAG TPA: hypothetical protein VMF13_15665 [Luteitalea sp.]|nr:hypothetical protein [Luteitalea sp.]
MVAVFEPMWDEASMLRLTVLLARCQLRPVACYATDQAPAAVKQQLADIAAVAVVWDVSPVTSSACAVLESLLEASTFQPFRLFVTTTHAAGLLDHFGRRSDGFVIFQKPYDLELLSAALARAVDVRGD